MMAATHRLGGLAAGMAIAVALHTPPADMGVIIAGAVLGSLLPDIDNRQSSISRKWRLAGMAVSVGQAVIRGIANFLPKKQDRYIRSLIGHRGLTHSLAAAALIPLAVAVGGRGLGIPGVGIYAGYGMSAGIVSHLLFDMLAGGVPLMMPFSVKRVCLAHIKTGGLTEWIFRAVLVLVFAALGVEVFLWQR